MKARRLTLKQTKFIKEYINNGGNGTQAALQTYDTEDPDTAHAISTENLQKPSIQQVVEEALRKNGLTPDTITDNLKHYAASRAEKVSADASIKANIELLKLWGAYPGSKHTQLNVNLKGDLAKMKYQEAKEALNKLREENNGLLEDIEEPQSEPDVAL